MRIAFCIFQYFPFGGLQRDSLRIAKECLRRGHSVHFITREWQGDRPEGLEITTLNVTSKTTHGASLEFSKRAVLLLQRGGFDLVVGFNKMPGLDLYFCGDHYFRTASENDLGVFSKFIPRYLVIYFVAKKDRSALIISARDMSAADRSHYERR